MSEDDRRLLAVLSSEPQHIDDLAMLSDSTVADTSARLMTLELQGLVRNAGAQHYTRA
jgi:predicted Rossmann fold nucleotide-binding protein DprA/Smf involved in DNA uptake